MSDTPRTDREAYVTKACDVGSPVVNPALCRQMEREIAALRKDAERYRWLRSEDTATNPLYYPFWQEFNVKLCREAQMDALIDSAMTSRMVVRGTEGGLIARCAVTGNPCGTDTVRKGDSCPGQRREVCQHIVARRNEMIEYEAITLPKDTLVHLCGMPFMVKAGTVIHGRQANYEVAMSMREAPQVSEQSSHCHSGEKP